MWCAVLCGVQCCVLRDMWFVVASAPLLVHWAVLLLVAQCFCGVYTSVAALGFEYVWCEWLVHPIYSVMVCCSLWV